MRFQLNSDTGFLPLIRAMARLTGIVAVVVFLVPVQFLVLISHRGNPFLLPRLFHRLVLAILGLKVRIRGTIVTDGPVLYVSNHSSYLDAPVLGSILGASFVAKAEVEDWPVIGVLSKLHLTAYVERRAVRAAEQRDRLRRRLWKGHNLILFPEGTSSDGQRVLPFKSSLFSIAELDRADGQPVVVQPLTILCTELGGLPIGRAERPIYAWFGDMTLIPHLWRVLKMGCFTVAVEVYPPVTIKDFHDRKALAAYCRKVIAHGVEQVLAGRG